MAAVGRVHLHTHPYLAVGLVAMEQRWAVYQLHMVVAYYVEGAHRGCWNSTTGQRRMSFAEKMAAFS